MTRGGKASENRAVTGPALRLALALGAGATLQEAARKVGVRLSDARTWTENPDVQAIIETQRVNKLAEKAVDQEWVRRRLRAIVIRYEENRASEAGALRALELLGKDLGLWPDKATLEVIARNSSDTYVLDMMRQALADGSLRQLAGQVPVLPAPTPGEGAGA